MHMQEQAPDRQCEPDDSVQSRFAVSVALKPRSECPLAWVWMDDLREIDWRRHAHCPALSEAAVKALEELAHCDHDLVSRASRLAREAGYSSLVIIRAADRVESAREGEPVFPPIALLRVPIEPLELAERLLPLADLCRLSEDGPSRTPPSSRLRMMFHIVFLAVLVFLQPIFFFVALGALTFAELAHWFQRRRVKWYIVPGGVIVLKARPWEFKPKMTQYTPADSTLMVRSMWRAEIWRDRRRIAVRRLTYLEARALVCAWQSPLPPPCPDRWTDLT